jgi:zeaxanthin glucosyltransferase
MLNHYTCTCIMLHRVFKGSTVRNFTRFTGMKSVVLFVILPFPSHYYASFSLAKQWQKQGYRVVFAGTSKMKSLIEDNGFEYYCLKYAVEYSINTFRGFIGLFLKSWVDNMFVIGRFREFTEAKLAVETMCERTKPSTIFVDEHLAEYYFFVKSYCTKITILNTKLSTAKTQGNTPLNSNYTPNDTLTSNLICALIWQFELLKVRSREMFLKIAFWGKDEIYFWQRLCKKKGWNWAAEISLNHSFYRSIKTIPTLILSPKELEFEHKKAIGNESYFHTKAERNEELYRNDAYKTLIEAINKRKLTISLKVIYITFGTLSGINFTKVQRYFMRLIDSSRGFENILLVFSKGNIPIGFNNLPNVLFIDYIPQLDFLQYADAVVCHGGLGTIKECYDARVPMLIVPINYKMDQIGNATRIAANGFGLKGTIDDSEEEIRRLLQQLLTFGFANQP